MKFDIKKKEVPNVRKYKGEDMEIAYEFAKKTYKEFGSFLKAIILFGSTIRHEKKNKEGDIDILLIVDDVSMVMTGDLVEVYRLIVEKIIAEKFAFEKYGEGFNRFYFEK